MRFILLTYSIFSLFLLKAQDTSKTEFTGKWYVIETGAKDTLSDFFDWIRIFNSDSSNISYSKLHSKLNFNSDSSYTEKIYGDPEPPTEDDLRSEKITGIKFVPYSYPVIDFLIGNWYIENDLLILESGKSRIVYQVIKEENTILLKKNKT